MSIDSDLSTKFNQAIDYMIANFNSLDTEVQLKLYAYYKQATVGSCDTPKPSWFDYKAKIKWKSWRECYGMSTYSAMLNYIQCLTNAVPDWENVSTNDQVNGITVSSLSSTDEYLSDNEKTVFDWVKEGNLDLLKHQNFDVCCKDGQGLMLLHWASDRGDVNIVRYLIEAKGANVNCLDNERQTPLHYASACGYPDIIEYLLNAGADYSITDENGKTPKDVAENVGIAKLFP